MLWDNETWANAPAPSRHTVTTSPKIAYLIPQFPGQTHIFFWRELQALENLGADVHVMSTTLPPPGLISHAWSDEAIQRTTFLATRSPIEMLSGLVKSRALGLAGDVRREGATLLKDIGVTAGAALRLARIATELRLDHIHVHSCGRAALIALLAHRMTGVPYSLTLHGPLQDYGAGQRAKWREAAFATVITCKLIDEVQTSLADGLPDRLLLQPMGVDTERLTRSTPYRPYDGNGPFRIFCVGRLNRVKGHQDLLAAVRQLVDRGVEVALEIAGEDDDGGHGFHRELQTELDRLRLGPHARLLGAISSDEVHRKLLEAHVFAAASWHEPLGVVYMEAMSSGVPVIGTAAGGVPELITEGENGLLVPPKTPEALANALDRLRLDPGLATGLATRGRAYAEAHCRSSIGAETLLREIALTDG